MNIQNIQNYLNQFDLDVRKTGDGRWIDQKCTPDVVCIIADCVREYTEVDNNIEFTANDIWDSDYFSNEVQNIFSKPNAQSLEAENEYDKFIAQPLRMLGYAQVLNFHKKGNRNIFSVKNRELLEFIALKERNAYRFIVEYVTKVLSDSDILHHFNTFKDLYKMGTATKSHFNELKNMFIKFEQTYTDINGDFEPKRIFPKVINPYACEHKIAGSEDGYMSKHIFNYNDLMYNKPNWRDKNKAKNMTRQEYEEVMSHRVNAYSDYQIKKAMNFIRKKYIESEVKQGDGLVSKATEVHHIFMKHEFPILADYLENLIKLTPTQHRNEAHPDANYKVISRDYQCICLISKSNSIEISLSNNEDFYSTENFVFVLNTGLSANLSNNSNLKEIRGFLAREYNKN